MKAKRIQPKNGQSLSKEKPAVDIASYLYGRCHIFALALHKALNLQMEFLWDDDAWDEDSDWDEDENSHCALLHAFCRRTDGTCVDAQGPFDPDKDMENYGEEPNDPAFCEMTEADVHQCITDQMLDPPQPKEIDNLVEYIHSDKDLYLSASSSDVAHKYWDE